MSSTLLYKFIFCPVTTLVVMLRKWTWHWQLFQMCSYTFFCNGFGSVFFYLEDFLSAHSSKGRWLILLTWHAVVVRRAKDEDRSLQIFQTSFISLRSPSSIFWWSKTNLEHSFCSQRWTENCPAMWWSCRCIISYHGGWSFHVEKSKF